MEFGVLILALVLPFVIRFRLASMPLERDEGEYACMAQGIFAGVPPFQEAFSVKFPGTALAYAGIMKIFGQTDWGVRMGLLTVNFLSVFLIFLICNQLLTDPRSHTSRPTLHASRFIQQELWKGLPWGMWRAAPRLAAVAFAVASLASSVLGLTANAEHFVVLFAMMGFALLLKGKDLTTETQSEQRGKSSHFSPPIPPKYNPKFFGLYFGKGFLGERKREALPVLCVSVVCLPFIFFLAGLCFGLSICMKQQGLFFAMFALIWVAWSACLAEARRRRMKRFARLQPSAFSLIAFISGLSLPLVLMVMWLKSNGTYESFRFWCFDYARHYGGMWGWKEGLYHFRLKFVPVLWEDWPFFILAAWGLLRSWQNNRRAFWFVSGLLLSGFGATCPGLIFRPHYFLFILPGLSLASGLGASEIGLFFQRAACSVRRETCGVERGEAAFVQRGAFSRLIPCSLFLLPILTQIPLFFLDSPEEVSRRLFSPNAFPEMKLIGLKLGEKLHSDSIATSHFAFRTPHSDDRMVILGSEPEIYFYSQTPPGSPYLYMYPMMEPQPFAGEMQRDFMERMEKSPPQFIVFLPGQDFPTSWLIYPHSKKELLSWVPRFLEKNYILDRKVSVGKEGNHHWVYIYKSRFSSKED